MCYTTFILDEQQRLNTSFPKKEVTVFFTIKGCLQDYAYLKILPSSAQSFFTAYGECAWTDINLVLRETNERFKNNQIVTKMKEHVRYLNY